MEHERDIASHGSILDGNEYLEVRLTPLVSFAVGWPMVSLLGKLGRFNWNLALQHSLQICGP